MTDTLTPELQQQNLINRYRNILDDIRDWRTMLGDTMLTITGYSMDLTGIPSSGEAPMPGGDALAMLGPWSPDADHGDDLPHPDQILREWRDTITGEHHRGPWAECWRWHRDQTPHLLELPHGQAWRNDIDALWSRLAHLTGHAPARPAPEPDDITTMGHLIPDDVTLTRDDAERFWPGKLDNTAWATLRKRAQRARHAGNQIPPRRYPVEWIRHQIENGSCT